MLFYSNITDYEELVEELEKSEYYKNTYEITKNNITIKFNLILRRVKTKQKIKNSNKYKENYEYFQIMVFDSEGHFYTSDCKKNGYFETIYDYKNQKIKIHTIEICNNDKDYNDDDDVIEDENHLIIKINHFIELDEYETNLNLNYLKKLILSEDDDNEKNRLIKIKNKILCYYKF